MRFTAIPFLPETGPDKTHGRQEAIRDGHGRFGAALRG